MFLVISVSFLKIISNEFSEIPLNSISISCLSATVSYFAVLISSLKSVSFKRIFREKSAFNDVVAVSPRSVISM